MTFERELIERVVSDVMRALASPAESNHSQPIAARSPKMQSPASVSGIQAESARKQQSVQTVESATHEFTLTDNVLQ